MSSILATISGQFGKALILSALLPVTVFVLLFQLLATPLLPADWPILTPLEVLDAQWRPLMLTLAVVVLTGLLFNLNVPIIRFYEGYVWLDTRLGRKRQAVYQEQFDQLHARWTGMRTLLRALTPGQPGYAAILDAWNQCGLQINQGLPDKRELVMPTRLGNVIRSFEQYPSRQYGIGSITLWPRLLAKVDKEYATLLGDARTAFDFTINSSALSALLAAVLLVSGLVYLGPLSSVSAGLAWLAAIASFGAIAYLFYLLSLGRAAWWGSVYKGAFDLYRRDVLKQLGYARVPRTLAEERALWGDVYQQLLYGDTPTTPLADYGEAPASASAQTSPPGSSDPSDLQVTRGVEGPDGDGRLVVTLAVTNVDERRRPATRVLVTDTLPDGFEYQWGSARVVGGASLAPVDTSPLRFEVGDIPHGQTVTMSYDMRPRKKG